LPPHVDRFFDVVGLPLLNGYGLTETAPLVSVRRRDRPAIGTVGPAIPGTDVDVRDKDGRSVAAGEVGVLFVKGPQVMPGYYKDRETTARVLTEDGWFDTGDLGRRHANGDIEITGRAKDTIVLRGGENVEPEPIENALRLSDVIDQVIVVGQDRKQLGALIVPDEEVLLQKLPVGPDGAPIDTPDERRKVVRAEVSRLLDRARGFKPFEQVRRFALLDEPFSVESGELTETLKPKRHVILRKRVAALAEMFAE
ncbi:MAG: AMP-binding protein, partial [Planctomycetota bacterium JB042]